MKDDLPVRFKRDGFVILNIFDDQEIQDLIAAIYKLVELGLGVKIFSYEDFSSHLLSLYKTDKKKYRNIVKRFFYLPQLARINSSEKILNILKFIGVSEPIWSTHPEVRTDNPNDLLYQQPLHQDWRSGQGSLNSITIWTPLIDVGLNNGSISIYPGTHKLGYIDARMEDNPRRFHAQISQEELENMGFKKQIVEIKKFQSVILSQFLLHSSNNNKSDQIRLTFQSRFNDLNCKRFIINEFAAPEKSDLIWEEPPTKAELEQVFE